MSIGLDIKDTISFGGIDGKEQSLHEGDSVSVFLKPDEGYLIQKFVIKDAEGGSTITEVKTDDDTFSFNMPN